MPKPSAFEMGMNIEKLKSHRAPGTDKIPAELIKAGGRVIRSQIHKLINSIWNKEELPEQWKESIIVHAYKKGDTSDFSNYTSVSLLLNMYKILSNMCSQGKTPYGEEIIEDHQSAFRCNRSTTDHMDLIYLVQDRDRWRALVNAVMKLWVP